MRWVTKSKRQDLLITPYQPSIAWGTTHLDKMQDVVGTGRAAKKFDSQHTKERPVVTLLQLENGSQ